MNASLQKVLVVAFLVSYLSGETLAAAIGETPITAGNTSINTEQPSNATADPSTAAAACEIKRIPDADGDTVTVTIQCTDTKGKVLQSATKTETVPEGQLPVTSVIRYTVKNSDRGYYIGSYAGSYSNGNIDTVGEDLIDSIGEIFDETGDLIKNIFNSW